MKTAQKKNSYLPLLFKYLKDQKALFLLLGVTIISGMIIQVINPQIVRQFIDAALGENANANLLNISLMFISLAIGQQLLSIATTYMAQQMGWRAMNELKEDLVEHCLKLDMEFHKNIRQGEIIEIIEGDVNVLFNFFSSMAIMLASSVFLLCGVLFMYYMEDFRIGIVQTLYACFAFFAMIQINKFGKDAWRKSREKAGQFFGLYGEIIHTTEDLKPNGAIAFAKEKCRRLLAAWLPIRIKAGIAGWLFFTVNLTIQLIGFGLSLGLGTWLWKSGAITVGTIYMFYNYTTYLLRPIETIQRQMQELQAVGASISRIEDLFNKKSMIKDNPNSIKLDSVLELELKAVDFSYSPNEPVLKKLSLKLEKGKSIGVVGRTGSGKTTLARLLLRFYEIDSGQILLGGVPIQNISLKELRKRVAYVTQDIQLFNGTIRDNLTFYNEDISDDQIHSAIVTMGIAPWFKKFENGLETQIGPKGIGLSAGEAQLLSFVRVFLTDPDIVILDEVSSKLDPETERQLQTAIIKLKENRIGIIIAHKLWTLEQVDDILILEKGEVLEYDNRTKLVSNNLSNFSRLLQTGLSEVVA